MWFAVSNTGIPDLLVNSNSDRVLWRASSSKPLRSERQMEDVELVAISIYVLVLASISIEKRGTWLGASNIGIIPDLLDNPD